ncbi:MAG: glycosyltransferase family A protein [Puia sp.]|nr:glycosyltransferase family A protein [Puia sp.]
MCKIFHTEMTAGIFFMHNNRREDMEIGTGNTSVSAVIPAYNAEGFISKTIQSVLAQTHKISEIIVVDDGSSDRTVEIAAGFPRTRVIQRPNGGPGAARNTGIHAASSDWIAFLDSDDVWTPQKTEIQLACITPDVGVIHANRFDPIHFGNLWHRQAHISPSGALVRKQSLLDVGCFEDSRAVSDDLTLWLKISLTDWRIVRSETDLFFYQGNEQSFSTNESRMAGMELTTLDMIGGRVSCQPEEIERIKLASRIEYAKNLIACHRWDEATQLLQQCAPGLASRWLSLAGFLKVNRLARTSLIRWLQSIDGQYQSHMCSGQCNLPVPQKKQCMECCRKPYFRP